MLYRRLLHHSPIRLLVHHNNSFNSESPNSSIPCGEGNLVGKKADKLTEISFGFMLNSDAVLVIRFKLYIKIIFSFSLDVTIPTSLPNSKNLMTHRLNRRSCPLIQTLMKANFMVGLQFNFVLIFLLSFFILFLIVLHPAFMTSYWVHLKRFFFCSQGLE